jgi:hypothetical protein
LNRGGSMTSFRGRFGLANGVTALGPRWALSVGQLFFRSCIGRMLSSVCR